MASEPNNNAESAEEQVKRYAAERRGQGAPELHPATRRLLQGEVARLYGRQGGAVRTGWRRWLLAPGFAWALGLAVVAGMTLLVVREAGPRRRTEEGTTVAEKVETQPKALDQMVKNEAAAASKAEQPAMVAPAPAPVTTAPEPAAEAREKKVTLQTKATSPGAVVVEREARRDVAVTQSAARALRDENVAGPLYSNRAYPQLAPAAAPAGASAVAKDAGMGGGGSPAQAQAQVMNRFRMQQVGQSVRFEDADKSVYAGPVTAQVAGTNSFRAVGTNLTLREPVVVTGQVYRTQGTLQQQQQVGGRQMLGAGDEYSYRVQGQATVGRTNQVLIDAASAAAAP